MNAYSSNAIFASSGGGFFAGCSRGCRIGKNRRHQRREGPVTIAGRGPVLMDSVETFIGEMRDRANGNPVLVAHVARVELALTKARESAEKMPADFDHRWRQIEGVISDRTLSGAACIIRPGR
jgi:hypothetical protein